MADIVSAATRSRMMAGIRAKDTRPEVAVRSGLHRRGLRFRLHDKSLPGRPDLVFARHRAVILVNGCFWHGHQCRLFKWPASRQEFWTSKISSNVRRDALNSRLLAETGWRIATIWECALKGRGKLPVEDMLDTVADWIRGSNQKFEVEGL